MREEALPARGVGAALRSELTTLRKAAYAMGSLGVGTVDYIVAVYLLKFYTDYAALDPKLAGLALLLGKAFDGVSDPVMGYISDRTKTRWGRRRPWFMAGIVPITLSFIAMFSPGHEWSQMQLFVWLTFTNILFYMGSTMFDVPHAALGSEWSRTHQERVSVMGWRQGLNSLGLFIGAVSPIIFIQSAEGQTAAAAATQGLAEVDVTLVVRAAGAAAYHGMAYKFGALVLLTVVITSRWTREPSGPRTPPRDSIFGDFLDTAKSGPFRLFIIIFILDQLSSGLTATLVLYAINNWWGFGGTHEPLLIMAYLGAGIVSIPMWMAIGREREKTHLFIVGAFIAMAALTGMAFIPQLGLAFAYVMMAFAGVGFGARAVMAMALIPDIVDDDELRTHTRKDGAYFGVWSLLRKMARALALGFAGIGLGYFGYQSGAAVQSPEAIRGIMIMFALIPGITAGLCGVLFFWFPLSRRTQSATAAELQRRRDAAQSTERA